MASVVQAYRRTALKHYPKYTRNPGQPYMTLHVTNNYVINWYGRPTVVQLLTSNGYTYRQMDVLTDTEMPDRQMCSLKVPGCMRGPMDMQGNIQTYKHTTWTYGHTDRHNDVPTNAQIYIQTARHTQMLDNPHMCDNYTLKEPKYVRSLPS